MSANPNEKLKNPRLNVKLYINGKYNQDNHLLPGFNSPHNFLNPEAPITRISNKRIFSERPAVKTDNKTVSIKCPIQFGSGK